VTLHEDGRAELGYIIFSRFWRRGFGQEACRCILQHLVEAHAPRVITLDTSGENAAARRLAQRLGFREVAPTDALHEGLDEGLRRYALDPHAQPPT
jgi:RimJ/RimL family protein N-acetyltransferase